MLELVIIGVYVALFAVLILMARSQNRTVWALMADSFRDISREMDKTLRALGLLPGQAPRPVSSPPVAPAAGEERRIASARRAYINGQIDVDEMERRIQATLDGTADRQHKAQMRQRCRNEGHDMVLVGGQAKPFCIYCGHRD